MSLLTLLGIVLLTAISGNTEKRDTPQKRQGVAQEIIVPVSKGIGKETPAEINYQGYLVNANDTSTVTDTLEMSFRIYNQPTGGSELWSETHPQVIVENGIFNVLLGGVTPIPSNIFTGAPLYLQTEIGIQPLMPRKKLVSVAYGMRSQLADTSGYAVSSYRSTYSDTATYALTANVIFVDSANVSANSYRWNGNLWGTEYPKANKADTANYVAGTNVGGEVANANHADTANYALTANVIFVDSANVSANAHKLQGKDTTALDARWVNENQANAVTSGMIQDGTIQRTDVVSNFKAPFADTADYVKTGTDTVTRYYNIPPAAFVPRLSSQTYVRGGEPSVALYPTNAPAGNHYFAPVYLPDGAKVIEFKAFICDSHQTMDMLIALKAQPNHGGSGGGWMVHTYSSGSGGEQEIIVTSINYPVIDNANYHYYILIDFTAGDSRLKVYNFRIKYEITKP